MTLYRSMKEREGLAYYMDTEYEPPYSGDYGEIRPMFEVLKEHPDQSCPWCDPTYNPAPFRGPPKEVVRRPHP